MQLEINGQVRTDCPPGNVRDVISFLGLVPETVLVELNGVALLRSEWESQTLQEGDRLEILRVAAGG